MTEKPGLPDVWVSKIFKKLTVRYGRDFLDRWEGVPIEDVKEDWAEVLAGFAVNPGAIGYALENLPDSKAPTAQDFRAICIRGPAVPVPLLPSPAADPVRRDAELAKLEGAMLAKREGRLIDFKAPHRMILANHAAGLQVNPGPLKFARQALGLLPWVA